jgi:histidinol phosphatase-like enzyme (inositol monophosphatase family)
MSLNLVEMALEASQLGGAVALAHYKKHVSGERLDVEIKSDGSPVSHADRASEEAVRAFLTKHFPDDGILGEELGLTRPDAPRRWVIDPIDGTKSFLAGVPLWGSLLALVEGENVLVGAAAFPVTGEAIAAAPGTGCKVIGGRAGVSATADLAQALVLATDEWFPEAPEVAPRFANLAKRARLARSWGDCYGYYLVATGRAEVMTDGKLSPWDAACFLPIIEEAGGVFTDWQGKRTVFGQGVIATNAALAKAARSALDVPFEPGA